MRWLSGQRWAIRYPVSRSSVAGGFAVLAALVIPSAPTASASAATGQPATAARGTVLEAWGRNDHGQLGDDTTISRKLPVKVKLPSGVTITSVRAGCLHTLALTSTGQLLAWGDNSFGELGDGAISSPNSTTPVSVKLPVGTKITAIRAGCAFSLALTSAGRVLSWGLDDFGQLGNGVANSDDVTRPAPVKLPAGTKVKGISAGSSHGLAVTTTGQVLSWGSNLSGEIGDGSTATQPTPSPVSLPQGTTVAAVAAGLEYSLVMTSQGQVWAWGLNADGELGTGTRTDSTSPVMTRLPADTRVRGLFAGCLHSLALTSAGKVLAWGDNSSGQLGDGTSKRRSVPVTSKMPKGTTVSAISAGCLQSLALTSSGKVLAWGSGGFGALGNGFTVDKHLPAAVKLPNGLTASAISSGPAAQDSLAIVHQATGVLVR